MRRLSRRELGQLTAAMAAVGAVPAAAQTATYTGPLTGLSGLADRRFDPVAYSLDVFAAAPRKLRFQSRTQRQAEAWQKALRAKLTELIGGFPADRTPLQA